GSAILPISSSMRAITTPYNCIQKGLTFITIVPECKGTIRISGVLRHQQTSPFQATTVPFACLSRNL
ncbi:MAG: hypothetical protein AB7I29_14805, partial [Geobacter sp.]